MPTSGLSRIEQPTDMRTMPLISVDVQFASRATGLPTVQAVQNWVRQALHPEGRGELTVRLVDASESRTLNRRFRGVDKPTNVLSFPADWAVEGGGRYLGDIAICTDVVHREAGEQGKPVEAHLAHMVVHGSLHLLGYDHQADEDADIMEAREVEIMAALGFEHPYRGGNAPHDNVLGTS